MEVMYSFWKLFLSKNYKAVMDPIAGGVDEINDQTAS